MFHREPLLSIIEIGNLGLEIRPEESIVLIKGSIPSAKGGIVYLKQRGGE